MNYCIDVRKRLAYLLKLAITQALLARIEDVKHL